MAGQAAVKSMILMTDLQTSTRTGQWGQFVVRPMWVRANSKEEEVGVVQHAGMALENLIFYFHP